MPDRVGRIPLLRLFWEYFKISLFIVGGGYAIIVAADEVFGKKLRWLREGELIDHLPIFQMIPGLIAGNSAIYVGLKLRGIPGVLTALSAVALPSFLIITAIAYGYDALPLDNAALQGAFIGLRSALTGIIVATLMKSWGRIMKGVYLFVALPVACLLLLALGLNPAFVLLGGMAYGILVECGRHLRGARVCEGVTLLTLFFLFVKFGLLCFGGGQVLVPLYIRDFVGPDAPMLNLAEEEFGNLLAITQMTPGPISINAATFFGFRFAGTVGSLVATAGLLLPSLILMVLALKSLDRFRANPIVRGLLWGVAPVTIALMVAAAVIFARMSVVDLASTGFPVRPVALLLAAFSCWALYRAKLHIMPLIAISAVVGALSSLW